MIVFELFSLNCSGTNINWQEKKININHNIKYIYVNLEHYNYNNEIEKNEKIINEAKNEINLNKSFTYSDISRHWIKNIHIYNKLFNINFTNLHIGIDYSIAPIYISRNNKKDLIIIGIFLLNNSNTSIIKPTYSNRYIFLSNINNTIINTTIKTSINKYKIITGILEYQNKNSCSSYFDNKYVTIANCKIPLKYILINACNYLPKLNISVNTNKLLQGSFKVSQIHKTT